MAYFMYILVCNDGTLYTGSTNDITKRLHEHNHRKSGARYTKLRRPVTLFYHESFSTLTEARKREAAVKKLQRKQKIALGVKQ